MATRLSFQQHLLCLIVVLSFIWTAKVTAKDGFKRNIFFNRDDYDAEHQEALEKFLNAAEKVCPNRTEEVKEKIEKLQECTENIDENEQMMCQVFEESIKKCFPPLFKLFENCVPQNAKGIPAYVLETSYNVLTYLCDLNGSHLIELGNPCILRKNHFESKKCIRKLRKEVNKYGFDNLPEKQVICWFLKDFKSCFDSHIDNSCGDAVTREAYKGLYNAFLCKE